MVLEAPRKGGGRSSWRSGGDSKTVVDGINGTARERSAGEEEAVGNAQQTSTGLVQQGRRIEEWRGRLGKAFFRQHKEAHAWAEKGARGLRIGRTSKRSDVAGICVCWDTSCRKNGCGAGMWVKIFTQGLDATPSTRSVDRCWVGILLMLQSRGAR